MRISPAILLLLASLTLPAISQSAPPKVAAHLDLVYAEAPTGQTLLLDLRVPEGVEKPPLVMFIHGGSWLRGSRKDNKLSWLVEKGYAVASIDYRFSSEALFPAQIHDCKGAVRWLRDPEQEQKYGYDASRIVVGGSSAGGHLAALLGTSGGVEALEGDIGGNLEISSKPFAVIDYYGPADFILRLNQPSKTEAPEGGVTLLLGGPVSQNRELAILASPVTHVSAGDPPLLILHGDKDKTVFLDQSEALVKKYQEQDLDVAFHIMEGAGHGWKGASDAEKAVVLEFLRKALGKVNSEQ